ncbi:DUF6492 family protein [Rhodoferax sp.]|uniref:DUF6492 family protein n=1 Tax=Rhodoferax sp. TaxID=50421 RepID=UPI0025FE4ABF|nr:DUF6492 family protein [Rhodoferax sp.]MCM2340605.1 DUF6492 family protein [Rhodoferax sp.]
MKPFVLFCKSYSTDLKRLIRLAQSVQKFNTENIPFYVSVPLTEFPLFHDHLSSFNVTLLTDEEIIKSSTAIDTEQLLRMPGSLSQQVIKSEFWRLGLSTAYLCLDSDAIFIRPFVLADFMTPDGTPYTMMDEARELLGQAMKRKSERIVSDYIKEAEQVQQHFHRIGRTYSFGPFPLVWHRAVWESLDTHYLKPKGMTFADAIALAPIESRWYGEALLAYQAVPLLPCQSLFKVYHYAWQYDQDRRAGITLEKLVPFYCGVLYQSAWERDMDWPREGGNRLSRIGRRLRRATGRI